MNVLFFEVIDFVTKMVDPTKIEHSLRWEKEPVITYGLNSFDFKKVYSRFDSRFCELHLDEAVELAGKLIKSRNSTLIHIGIHILETRREELSPVHLPCFDEFLDRFVSWGNVDHLCTGRDSVLKMMLEKYPEQVIELLGRWNKSSNRWKRRASVVVFTRSVAKSGRFIDEALALCENLIWDEEDLVRKGVGWTLKDHMRSDKERVLEYVKSLRRRGVPSVITLYAIRDLRGKEREEVLKIKKEK